MSIDRSIYRGVPADDFPIAAIPSALSGTHPKMSLVEADGKYYAPGTSPSEVVPAFEVCEDLVVQMVPYCERKLAASQGEQEATKSEQVLPRRFDAAAEQPASLVPLPVSQLNRCSAHRTLGRVADQANDSFLINGSVLHGN